MAITQSFEKAIRLSSTEQNGQLIAPQSNNTASPLVSTIVYLGLNNFGCAIKSLSYKRALKRPEATLTGQKHSWYFTG